MIFLCGCICLPSSCLTDGQSLLVVSTPQHGVNRHCISVALSVHRRPTTTSGKHAAAWCEPTLHICGIGMASTLQHGVNRHCLTKAHLRWSSSCFSHRHSLLVESTSQYGVNRHGIWVALSGHRRPIIEARCTSTPGFAAYMRKYMKG